MYNCQHKAHINKLMTSELKIMQDILLYPRKYNLKNPIAHLVVGEQYCIAYGDACLESGGGVSEVSFWWHVERTENINLSH